ncbi:uncharacterized protein HMPREF1541_07419 [Cyphellophora europaea CBS 101466]|uniref:DUF7730 domain-containing protein n=1 Tax=Cyphellophora europaea (strain CBS 101466) TaxID=1220924 RepID=W2RMR4_CYPE1|nr:uncharacterized protein HMPREF1541_07419 [Cyphellophora europaea CBS 101466]ETN37796.1 hypothetical protein HMPREF1541_07419 [Cyphellophora europaea CBS 101466]
MLSRAVAARALDNLHEAFQDQNPGSLFAAVRLAKTEAYACHLVRAGFDFDEFKIDRLVSDQLQRELKESLVRDAQPAIDGIGNCPLYTKLPTEVRQHIFRYLVEAPESIHLHPVKGNVKLGFRLSRCGDAMLNMDSGHCNCERGFSFRVQAADNPPPFLQTELLLLSRMIRREALDLIFTKNRFTFTSLRDLNYFAESFSKSAAKLQHIQILERCSDGCHSPWMNRSIIETRKKLGHLQSLELLLYLDQFTVYESPYPDGYLIPLLPLYFNGPTTLPTGPPTLATPAETGPSTTQLLSAKPADQPIPPASVSITVRTTRLWNEPSTLPLIASYVEDKLKDIFAGKWRTQEDVPIAEPPKRKLPESERAPENRRGLLVLGD